MKTRLLIIIVTSSILAVSIGHVVWLEYGMVCNNAVVEHLQKYSNLFEKNITHETYAILDIGFPFGVHKLNIQECVNHTLEKRKIDMVPENMLSSKSTGMDDVGKLLVLNQIDYNPDTLVVTRGPAFEEDSGCGAVIDAKSETHWFKIDSVSNPKNMTLYSENPRPCKINHSSCFCNAQMELVSMTIGELSYFTPE